MKCLQAGSKGRVTGATAMNKQSSRSHAIFTLTLQQQKQNDPTSATTAKFHMVDLAGSERSKKTLAEGDRFKEGVTINSGLLALGNIIAALGEGGKQVPSFRNSKLTRMLQDSLGGNSLTLMIACISPADYNMDETVSTLRYAHRARQIKNKPIVNQDPKSAEIAMLKAKVSELQLQMLAGGQLVERDLVDPQVQERVLELENKVRELTKQLNISLSHNAEMADKMLIIENGRDRLKEHLLELQSEVENKLNNFETLALNSETKGCLEILKKSFCDKVVAMQDEQKRSEDEQRKTETMLEAFAPVSNSTEGDSAEDLLEQDLLQEEHAEKGTKLTQELRELNKDLAIREVICEQHTKNKALFEETAKESLKLKMIYEKQIHDLEKEKTELICSIKQLEALNKQAEAKAKQTELSKKNGQIEALQKKIAEQGKIVKQKEEAEKKVEQLSSEIRQMKQVKVKLVRQMKQESDQWKAWRNQREREAVKLREQDRKKQNEIVKLLSLHSKRQNVSKRKLEEAIAVNKRLKEALSRQKSVRGQREMRGNKEQVQDFVSREIEVLVSTVDAERTLQLLLEERATLSARIADMRRVTFDNSVRLQMDKVQQELELRNAQIADIQQKILDSDQESRGKTRWETVGSMADAKVALVHAMRLAADIRRDALLKEAAQQDLKTNEEAMHQKLVDLETELAQQRDRHQEDLLKLEQAHQESLQSLLQSVDKENNPVIKTKEIELQQKDEECSELRSKLTTIMSAVALTPRVKNRGSIYNEYEDANLSCENTPHDDPVKDPDWGNTPIHHRLKMMKTSMAPVPLSKRFEDLSRCACRSNCATKRCFCKRAQGQCGPDCACDPKKCVFKLPSFSMTSDDSSEINSTFTMDDTDASRPKRRRITGLDDKSKLKS